MIEKKGELSRLTHVSQSKRILSLIFERLRPSVSIRVYVHRPINLLRKT